VFFTCFFIIFLSYIDLRGSIMHNYWEFRPQILGDDKNLVLLHFDLKSSKLTKMDLCGFMVCMAVKAYNT